MYDNRQEYLSLKRTKAAKGVFCLLILAHHIRNEFSFSDSSLIGMMLTAIGYLSVSMFMFYSGYGLMKSWENKGNNYIVTLPRKRIVPLYLMNVVSILIYLIYDVSLGSMPKAEEFIFSFFFGKTIVLYGWYLQSIVILYVIFWASSLLSKIQNMKFAGYMIFLLSLYMIIAIRLTSGTKYYETILAFCLGMLWSKYKGKIDSFIQNKYWQCLCVSAIAFFLSLIFGNIHLYGNSVRIIIKMISSPLFATLMLIVMWIIPNIGRFFEWLGNYSYEVYVMQGISISLFHSNICRINNVVLYVMAVVICTFALAVTIHPVFEWVIRKSKPSS